MKPPRWPPQDFRLIETMATSVASGPWQHPWQVETSTDISSYRSSLFAPLNQIIEQYKQHKFIKHVTECMSVSVNAKTLNQQRSEA